MDDVERFAFGRSQLVTFALFALVALAALVFGAAQGDVVVLVFGAAFAALAAFFARSALGPAQAYEVRPDALVHLRGGETVLRVPWDEVTGVRRIEQPRVGIDLLGLDVRDLSVIEGGDAYRNTRKTTGVDIGLGLGPVKDAERLVASAKARASGVAA